MIATVHLTDEELNDLRALTHVESAEGAVRTALDEYRRYARRMQGTAPKRRSIGEFIGKWAGAFSITRSADEDPRLDDLLKKHVR